MSIYDELLKLQNIPDAFKQWEAYRNELTNPIRSATGKKSTVAVFGAGKCNDLDLCELKEHFEHITLIDKEKSGMYRALEQYHLQREEKISLREADFLGIAPEDYRAYADDILKMIQVDGRNTDMSEVAEYAILSMERLYQAAFCHVPDFGDKKYDYVVAVGVHSQINNMFAWLWQVYLEAVGQQEERVFSYIKEKNNQVIQRFDDALFRSAKKGALIGCENRRIGQQGAIQGALQAIEDIQRRDRVGECEIAQTISLDWPFDRGQGITYQMMLFDVRF